MNGSTLYFLNVNFKCNERCIFCAAGLADGAMTTPGRPHGVTADDVYRWTLRDPPREGDEVAIAGGEPTLHPDLLSIVRHLAKDGAAVTLFTNGLRLANAEFAKSVLAAGVSRIEIALFGATAHAHESVTRRRSFDRTLRALKVLGELHGQYEFVIEVRLLVAQQCYRDNADIVRLVAAQLPGVDAISINRLILSDDAAAAGSAVSWAEAADSVNETAELIRRHAYEFRFESIPLCVYKGENAEFIRGSVATQRESGITPKPPIRYLDPRSAAGGQIGELRAPLGLPGPCRICDFLPVCGRVEQWYLSQFGTQGLTPFRHEVH
ncbi:radical SAM protein [Nocardia niigatensis]